ncbi:MAG TPA: hypothetical protein DEB70_09570 [Planctomycetaceae bacterium]|nr:hypothetical protein [Planctomycetaceae bacterium]
MTLAIGLVAMVYATVGHAGATGYIAVMTLFGLSAESIRPVALILNVVVGVITAVQFSSAGYLRTQLILPLICGSIPAALVGGWLTPPVPVLEMIVGCVLILSAVRIGYNKDLQGNSMNRQSGSVRATLVMAGVFLGLLSGLTGVGGGVFLTPALLAMRVAPVKQVAATSAVFIVVNSIAGLVGWMSAGNTLPGIAPGLLVAVGVGGFVGSRLGAFHLTPQLLRGCIACVLVLAGVKLVFHAMWGSGVLPVYV